jgi:hypothetical protein
VEAGHQARKCELDADHKDADNASVKARLVYEGLLSQETR